MGTLTIRRVDDDIKRQLRVRAAQAGVSVEEEVRTIMKSAREQESQPEFGLGTRIHELFKGLDWDESLLPSRDQPVKFVDFDE